MGYISKVFWMMARYAEQPQHPVTLAEFYIGKYEVTNDQYAEFVEATGHRVPHDWAIGKIPAGTEAHPVANVSMRHEMIRWHSPNGSVRKPA